MNEAVGAARGLLEYLARALVSDPERVEVAQRSGDRGEVVLELSVSEEDFGKVIGKGGCTARALRKVVGAAARARSDEVVQRVRVEVVTLP